MESLQRKAEEKRKRERRGEGIAYWHRIAQLGLEGACGGTKSLLNNSAASGHSGPCFEYL